ncbi:tripartite tricarboxylate transporter TctB family protein [Falsiroseomonas sp. HW251]|uniref:tripartite tricarboxylate transporter TctB family protein n=1 Tax=Falsiroseomonas sp. HW251 TaxID=3390998 RepID=UPI003D32013C
MESEAPPAPGIGETAALAFVFAFSLGAVALALAYPLWEYMQPGPGLFPAIAASLSALCASATLGEALLARRRGTAVTGERIEWRRLLVYAAIVLAWPASFATLGFAVSSLLALALLMRLGEGMRWTAALGIAGATVGLGWLLFERLLGVPLPHGVLPA